ncbi:MAG: outer membrane protein assembly factor BamB family protein [Kofleriaceae bacterium]
MSISGRWLVTLAIAVVALPEVAEAAGFRVEHANRTITTSRTLPVPARLPRVAPLPPWVELDRGTLQVVVGERLVSHALCPDGGLSWIATVGPCVVVGFAARPGGHADSIVAIDHATGAQLWRRSIDSLLGTELAGELLAVERAGALDVLDARTGRTLGTTPLAGQGIVAVSRAGAGDLHLKTRGDLVAIDRSTGAVRWVQPSSSVGNAAVTATTVVDAWVDRTTHRFGIVTYDAASGRRLHSIDLGSTSGWYDAERVVLAPEGAGDVLVSAMFALE